MRRFRIILLLLPVTIGILAGLVWAAHNANHNETPTSSGYFTIQAGTIRPNQNVTDYEWYNVEIRALITGVHFNLNQPARTYDSSADTWSRVFTAKGATFTTNDYIAFCGPQSSFTIQARDKDTFNGVGEATLIGVTKCK